LAIVLRAFHTKTIKKGTSTCINKDGFITAHDILDKNKMADINRLWDAGEFKAIDDIIKNDINANALIYSILPKTFKFMDYIMFIEKSVIHSAHRDQNSDRFNDINEPSYTMIIYIGDMQDCLDVTPGSHKPNDTGIYLYDKSQTFKCSSGSVILFDSGLVHSGSLGSSPNNRRIQLKVSCESDFQKLSYYQGYHKLMQKENTNPEWLKYIQKHFTSQYPLLADLTQGNASRDYIDGNLSWYQKLFSMAFYSDPNYYKLSDAW
jgi:hypothetical protein